jgi:hypothetical protein
MTDAPTLVEFLHARLDEDERVAHDALLGYPASMHASAGQPALPLPTPTTPGAEWRAEYQNVRRTDGFRIVAEATQASAQVADHIARHDPARVLAEVTAKRQLIKQIESYESWIHREWGTTGAGFSDDESALRFLALPYAEHPDYRAGEWAP